jgi:putative hydrolase of HD superfamily
MALIHDMAESLVGDITPVDGVPKAEKSRREAATMDFLCGGLLGGVSGGIGGDAGAGADAAAAAGGAGAAIRAIWQEYEEGVTLEARFVHDVDKMELLLQMLEYERAERGRVDLSEFTWVAERIGLVEVRAWAEELLQERERFWEGVKKGAEEEKRGEGDDDKVV